MGPMQVSDYRELARRRLPPFLFEYIDGGSFGEETLKSNVHDLSKVSLRQRTLKGKGEPDTSCRIFGTHCAMPVALAPVGLAGMYARRGEVQAARAADAAQIPFTLSTVSVCSLAETALASGRPLWFQLYMMRDRVLVRDLLIAAREAKCSALVFTVDMPVPGTRYRDYRSGLAGNSGFAGSLRRALQAARHPRWAADVGLMGRPHELGNVAPVLAGRTGMEDFTRWMGKNFDPTISWKDLEFVRSEWPGPLVIKGILDPYDAKCAAEIGADGIVVSNHGGRQLDGAPSTVQALPAIAQATEGKLTVLADGGVRSGLDVFRMLALGADGVLLGRAWAYALAGRGEAGVSHMLETIACELRVAMTLTGVGNVAEIGPELLFDPKRFDVP